MTVDGRSEARYLNVRETAQRLGVHENTVRNWVRAGILPTARVPGSRFHRFDERDVERLRVQRGAPVSTVEAERRTIGPELIDASQLNEWARTASREAQSTFPELMRRLLASTPGVTDISIRAGDGISAPGWDGRATCAGVSFLPDGALCFEFGTGEQPKLKADADYEKRRDDPLGIDPRKSCFVFVTPRRWTGAASWAAERSKDGVFGDVRALDADDLEGWLQAIPSVHYWISERLGRRPKDAETLYDWWRRFQSKTQPALPAELFLAGREKQRDRLVAFLGGPPAAIVIQAAWLDDAIAFTSATLDWMSKERRDVPTPLVVSSGDVWNRVAKQTRPLTLVAVVDELDINAAVESGHHVVIPVGVDHAVRGERLGLDPPNRDGARQALEAAGIPFDRAYRLSALARRSVPALIRALAVDPRLTRPDWSQPTAAQTLAPLVLAGGWTTSHQADLDVVSRLVGQDWPRIERQLRHWRNTDDPPFIRSGDEWHLASPEEALLVLHEQLTSDDLERWHSIVPEVLLESDPALDLEPTERSTASLIGSVRKHSAVLRRGIAEGIALVGTAAEGPLGDIATGADHARHLVRDILTRANTDDSSRTWSSLSEVLPLLAEAAPDTFLDAVEDDLDQSAPLLRAMFQDNGPDSWLYPSSPHTGLLWALETLCWSEAYLLRSSLVLARLEVLDPGGRLSNRPLESLHTVLVGWIRHTSAPLELKARSVEQICRKIPSVGWQLLLRLWPSDHSVTSPPTTPRYHDWIPESRNVTIAEWVKYIGRLVDLAIELVAEDPDRWASLAEHLSPLPPDDRERLLDGLDEAAKVEGIDGQSRLVLWERLHKVVARHRQFADADWSMDEESLSRMEAIADRLTPTGSVERFAYLFDWRPDLPEVKRDDFRAYDKRLWDLRQQAVQQVLDTASLDGLGALADRVEVPQHLGWIVGAVASDELTPQLLTWLDSESEKRRVTAGSWAAHKLQSEHGVGWLCEALTRPEMEAKGRRLALTVQMPPTSDYWDALAELDSALADDYWNHMRALRVPSPDTARATKELLAHGRPWTAIDLIAHELHVAPEEGETRSLTPAVAQSALDAAMRTESSEQLRQNLGYELGVIFDYLERSNLDTAELAGYEFVFFRLVEQHRSPRALSATLSNDPSLFVDMVSRVYRGKNEAPRQLSQADQRLAQHAWWVLAHWKTIPGIRDDGTVDGDHLKQWVAVARLAFADRERADIGDEQIGQVLSQSPPGVDDIWPAEPVREIVETIGSTSVEAGLHTGAINNRGITSRGVFDGGHLERQEAARYREWSRRTAGEWPRTSRVLRRLAESYEWEAQREDARAEVSADTE
jgi:excisionase family DNA binding protein